MSPVLNTPTPKTSIGARYAPVEFSQKEVITFALASYVTFVVAVQMLGGFWKYAAEFGDVPIYVSISQAIRHWDFQGIGVLKHFWGVSYASAAVAAVAGLSDLAALSAVCIASSISSLLVAFRLWGGWVAALFAVVSFDWIQTSLLGGSEAPFVAFTLGSFLALRKDRWILAALLASCSATVRPVGAFVLASIALAFLLRGEYRKLAAATGIGIAIGALYALPLFLLFGDPLTPLRAYRRDWISDSPISIPFVALLQGFQRSTEPATNTIRILAWILVILAGAIAMLATQRFRRYARSHPAEAAFAALYLAFLFSYNSPMWAWADFPRFAIPALPFVLFALEDWLPKRRLLVWTIGLASALLSAASAVNVRYALEQIQKLL